MIQTTHRWRSGRVLTAKKLKKTPLQDKFSCSDHVTTFSRLLFFRLCLCDPRGGGLWGRIPDAWCDQENPSQQEVPVFVSALPPLGFRARHAPGPAPVLGGWPGVHGADARLGRHHHADGGCWVSWLPVSGIYQKPVSLLSSHINMRRTRKCLQLTFWGLQGTTSSRHSADIWGQLYCIASAQFTPVRERNSSNLGLRHANSDFHFLN